MRGSERIRAALPFATLALALLAGCGNDYTLDAPPAFRRYHDASDLRLITPDGVRVAAREVENEPRADLPFWVDAMKRHLDERGYAFAREDCFTTAAGWKGCTLDFVLPFGAEDWVMSETVFVVGDTVVLVEATGPFERFATVEAAYKQSLRTLRRQ